MNTRPDTVIRSHQIATMAGQEGLGLVDGWIALKDGNILAVEAGEVPQAWCEGDEDEDEDAGWSRTLSEAFDGSASVFLHDFSPEMPGKPSHASACGITHVDARNRVVLPGFVDAHTHLVHAGTRENELALKLAGVPYLDILAQGGGIHGTVRKTRAASAADLYDKAKHSLDVMLEHGTTTVEAKSGYGLDLDTELRCLTVARDLDGRHPVDLVSTYLGAHAVPVEFKGNTRGYMDFMMQAVMPLVQMEGLAEFLDVFCEEGVFSPEESRELLDAGQRMGFGLKLHADEIIPLLGAELAAEFGAVSADHLLAASDAGIEALARSGVTAVLLPGTSFYLMTGKFARARRMIEAGVRVAVASDYNPGTCPCENLQAIQTFACMGLRMTPAEILRGMTLHGAYAIRREKTIGSLEAGKQADLVLYDAPNPEWLIYHFGSNPVDVVYKKGHVVVRNGRRISQ